MNAKRLVTLTVLLSSLFLFNISACLAEPVRIMPLGDSITGSPGCWRALLWKDLTDNGFTNIDFVGTQYPQGCAFPYDGEHEGHGGALAINVANANELVGWLSASNPDIVLMHFGTNDVWSGRSTQDILDAFTTLVNQMRRNNADMIILVAQIIPLDPDFCSESEPACTQPQRTIDLNNAIPSWAQGLSTGRSPIVVVDQWSNFNPRADTWEGAHPNDNGIRKIADNWYGPLSSILAGMDPGTIEPESPVCDSSDIMPYIQINDGAWSQNDAFSVRVGDRVVLSPKSVDEGQWGWTGPNGFVAGTSQVTLENIQTYQGGIYSATLTNTCGAVSTQDFSVTVPTPAEEEPETDPTPDNTGGCEGNGPFGGCGG